MVNGLGAEAEKLSHLKGGIPPNQTGQLVTGQKARRSPAIRLRQPTARLGYGSLNR